MYQHDSEKEGVKIHPFHLPWIRACWAVTISQERTQNQVSVKILLYLNVGELLKGTDSEIVGDVY